jgi:succinate dehydrogenase / fumarate reductase cytochrome b subunit
MTDKAPSRPEFRNINAFNDLPTYRLPPAGWVSILHRVSGALMFLLLPFIIWLFDKSVSSEYSFAKFKAAYNGGIGWYPICTWTPPTRSAKNLAAPVPSSPWRQASV